jgi:hypothetical protein
VAPKRIDFDGEAKREPRSSERERGPKGNSKDVQWQTRHQALDNKEQDGQGRGVSSWGPSAHAVADRNPGQLGGTTPWGSGADTGNVTQSHVPSQSMGSWGRV